ncbi:small, acid-soluble spore protein, H family [Alicyclobacillus dauci]
MTLNIQRAREIAESGEMVNVTYASDPSNPKAGEISVNA